MSVMYKSKEWMQNNVFNYDPSIQPKKMYKTVVNYNEMEMKLRSDQQRKNPSRKKKYFE